MLVAGALLAVALLASLVAGRLRVPGLLLFLGVGMLLGSDGLDAIHFDDYDLARKIGIVALALILFEGGLTAGWDEIRPVFWPSVSLATVGTLASAVITGLAASYLFDLSTLEGMLIGSIVASTDGAAIFALLRVSTLRRKLARTLEGEAGMNDPVAVLLVLGFIEWIKDPAYGVADMAGLAVLELGVGSAVGVAVGWLAVQGLNRTRLASAGLYPVASIAAAGLSFGLADIAHGSGFLAVYLTGLVMGTSLTQAKRTVVTFHEGLAWVAQVGMFLALGLLVFPSQLPEVALKGTVLAIVLTVVARSASTALATLPFRYEARERITLSWAGLRGAIPVVLATFPITEGVPGSLDFFNIVFFAVLISTVLQGTTFEPLAKRLGMTTNEAALPRPLAEAGTIRRLGAEVVEFPVGPDDAIAGRMIRELGLPREALLNVIVRGEQAIPPRGSTRVEAGDRLHILVRQEVAIEFRDLLERWRNGPIGRPARKPVKARSSQAIATSRPWREPDGDPAHPGRIGGEDVVEQLRTRRDGVPGALVVLEDGRFAISGPVLMIGSSQALQRNVRRRIPSARGDGERAWWAEVVAALVGEELRP